MRLLYRKRKYWISIGAFVFFLFFLYPVLEIGWLVATSDATGKKDEIYMGYEDATHMLIPYDYLDNYRTEFHKKNLGVLVSFASTIAEQNKEREHRLDIVSLPSNQVIFSEHPNPKNTAGFGIALPADKWKDGTYIARVYREDQLIAKRTFTLTSNMPWIQEHFIWGEKFIHMLKGK
ncbi:hypothetical protein [Laceyella putida]|uniref:Uncharacterized protein n=1 Tax=Laceyella putida TaxID=110101 RepID=A0ABW2RFV0_9BACL